MLTLNLYIAGTSIEKVVRDYVYRVKDKPVRFLNQARSENSCADIVEEAMAEYQ